MTSEQRARFAYDFLCLVNKTQGSNIKFSNDLSMTWTDTNHAQTIQCSNRDKPSGRSFLFNDFHNAVNQLCQADLKNRLPYYLFWTVTLIDMQQSEAEKQIKKYRNENKDMVTAITAEEMLEVYWDEMLPTITPKQKWHDTAETHNTCRLYNNGTKGQPPEIYPRGH